MKFWPEFLPRWCGDWTSGSAFHLQFRQSEVFGLFRSWHNRRSLEPASPLSRLTLAIAYATEAHLFITDVNQSRCSRRHPTTSSWQKFKVSWISFLPVPPVGSAHKPTKSCTQGIG